MKKVLACLLALGLVVGDVPVAQAAEAAATTDAAVVTTGEVISETESETEAVKSEVAEDEEELYGNITVEETASGVPDYEQFQSKHPVTAGTDKLWTYASGQNWEAMEITFSGDTSAYVEGADESDNFIAVRAQWDDDEEWYSFNQYCYGDGWAGKTITVPGNIVYIETNMNTGGAYGFDVVSVKEGSLDNLSVGTVEVGNTAAGEADLSKFQSKHPADEGTDKTWTYTADADCQGLAVTFSEDTSLFYDEDADYMDSIRVWGDYDEDSEEYTYSRTFYGSELTGNTINIPGKSVSIRLRTYGSTSQGFKVTSVKQISEDDLLEGTVKVTDVSKFQSKHPAEAGTAKTWKYTSSEEWEATAVTFSEATELDTENEDYIKVSSGNNFSKNYYGSDLAGKTIVVAGNQVNVSLYTYGNESYGFAVTSIAEGRIEDVTIGPKVIKNDYLKVVTNDTGCNFSLGTVGGNPENTKDDNQKMLFGFPGDGTSYVSLKIDGEIDTYGTDIPVTNKGTALCSSSTIDEIQVTQNLELVKNTSTNREDVLKISYTCKNTDTESHQVGCRFMLDTMLGDNDSAPFRVPGVGDVTTYKKFTGDQIPQYWQAFDDLSDPTVIAQGSVLRDSENRPDEMLLTGYEYAVDAEWDENFTEDKENGDSAVVLIWEAKELAPGAEITYTTYYGLSELEQDSSGKLPLSIYGDLYAAQSDYNEETGLPVYDDMTYTAYLNNPTDSTITNAKASIEVPEGFALAPGEEQTQTFAKIEPQEVKQVDWQVQLDPEKVEPGQTYEVKITSSADGDAPKELTRSVTIPGTLVEKTDIAEVATVDPIEAQEYTGSAVEPKVTVKNGDAILKEGTNYTLSYENNTQAGTATVKISGAGMYTGSISKTFTIQSKALSDAGVSLSQQTYTYSGQVCTPAVTVKDGEKVLTANTDYTVAYASNVNVGTATVTVTGKGNYTGSINKSFTINPKALVNEGVSLSQQTYTYSGQACAPTVTVKDGEKVLTANTDYTVAYASNVNVGTATVTVTGKGNYTGSINKSFTINPKALVNEGVSLSQQTYTYSGQACTPAVTVKDGEKVLVGNTDYTVAYASNVNAGTATVTVTGKGNYTGSINKSFTINPKALVNEGVSLSQQTYTYSGQACTPAVTVKDGEKVLTGNTDYTVAYASNVNVGTATVTVTGKGNYTGSINKTFTINPKAMVNDGVSLSQQTYTYSGEACTPAVTVKDGEKVLTGNTDYTVSYASNINVGTATVTVTGKGNYIGTITKEFSINQKDISTGYIIKLLTETYIFDNKEYCPEVVIDGLNSETDYLISYLNNIGAGTAQTVVTGKGNYTGTITKEFTITPKALTDSDVTLSQEVYTYNGQACIPAVTVKDGDKALAADTDYTLAYASNTNAGTATVTVTGKGNYTGEVTKQFTIAPKALDSKNIKLTTTKYTYSGKAFTPGAKVSDAGKTLTKDTDYKITYKNNKNVGTATATITGNGNYKGTITKTFQIVLGKVSGGKFSSVKPNSMKLSWKKLAGAKGYEVYQLNGKKWTKIKTTTSTSYTISNLNVGTSYKFKVRAYTKSGSKTFYGSYSSEYKKSTSSKGLTSYGLKTGKKQVTGSWKKFSGAKGYKVYYRAAKTSKWTAVKSSGTSFKKTGLKKGKTYEFMVEAYKTVGSGKNKKTIIIARSKKSIKVK